ncbi:hypothetical protein CR513_03663, partial [Mucuna pruriens]
MPSSIGFLLKKCISSNLLALKQRASFLFASCKRLFMGLNRPFNHSLKGNNHVIMLVYVDNIIVVGDH